MGRRNNCQPARGVSTSKESPATWDQFDALPRPLREALWESPVPINVDSVAGAFSYSSASTVLRRIQDSVRQEISLFAHQHRMRHGYDLPHEAAMASVQPYVTIQSRERSGRRRR